MDAAAPEYSDDALRVAMAAAREGAIQRRKRELPRRSAGQFVQRVRPATGTAARLMHALQAAQARPICEGGLSHYFIAEASRRWQLERSRDSREASIDSALQAVASLHVVCAGQTGECVVCMDEISSKRVTLTCGHSFHKTCIVSWLQINWSCPCCRDQVRRQEPYRHPARTKLQSAWLRTRMQRRLDWRSASIGIQFCDGMTGAVQDLCAQPPTSLSALSSTLDRTVDETLGE